MKAYYPNQNDLTIVLSNSLINSNYRLKIDEIRLIYIALTKVDSRKANIRTIEVYTDEFAEMFNLSPKNISRNMQNALVSIRDKRLKIKSLNSEPEEKLIKWFSICDYHRSSDGGHRIELKFSDCISPHLFKLKEHFTIVKLNDIRKLKTPFAHSLYLWLIREYKMKSGNYYDLKLLLKTIKERFLIPADSYTKWRDFKKIVLQPAINEINSKTNLSISYETKTRSNKVYLIQFIYIDESKKTVTNQNESIASYSITPERPRLARRPQANAGSNKEGEWIRKNFKLLSNYYEDLKKWNPSAKLTMQDLNRMVCYAKAMHSESYKKFKNEQIERQQKPFFSKKEAA